MKKLIAKYKRMTFKERMILTTAITMSLSCVIAVGKILLGLFSDPVMCIAGLFNLMLLFAKLECVLGVKNKKKSFKQRNALVSMFLLIAGLIYVLYMGKDLIFPTQAALYSGWEAIMIAFIGFVEMGMSISGLIRTKGKGHFFRDVKTINFAAALTAIMTAQIALLSFTQGEGGNYNCFTGMGIGVVTVLLAVYIYFAPKISVIDREHNIFRLCVKENNRLIDCDKQAAEILLCKSKVYGNYIYKSSVVDGKIEGDIIKENYFWKNLNIFGKITFIVLSEILVFVWVIGYVVYFCRSCNMPKKLKSIMTKNGFERVGMYINEKGEKTMQGDRIEEHIKYSGPKFKAHIRQAEPRFEEYIEREEKTATESNVEADLENRIDRHIEKSGKQLHQHVL